MVGLGQPSDIDQGRFASVRAAFRPPNPPPMTHTRGPVLSAEDSSPKPPVALKAVGKIGDEVGRLRPLKVLRKGGYVVDRTLSLRAPGDTGALLRGGAMPDGEMDTGANAEDWTIA